MCYRTISRDISRSNSIITFCHGLAKTLGILYHFFQCSRSWEDFCHTQLFVYSGYLDVLTTQEINGVTTNKQELRM
jgi:hypothetical protein